MITTDNCVDIKEKSDIPTVCSKCADGYWLKSYNKSCVAVKLTTCLTWKSGVNIETCATYNCTKIHSKCISCSSDTICTECNS